MKCDICGSKVQETFLNKMVGTYIKKPGSNKKYLVCFECQKKFKTKEELIGRIS